MSREADRVDRLIRQLLNFTRPAPVDFQYVDLTQIIDEALGLALLKARLVGITAEVSYDPSVPMVFADAGRLQQAMLNLMFNSIDAMPSGGTLTIVRSSRGLDIHRITVAAREACRSLPTECSHSTTRKHRTGAGSGRTVVSSQWGHHSRVVWGGTVFA